MYTLHGLLSWRWGSVGPSFPGKDQMNEKWPITSDSIYQYLKTRIDFDASSEMVMAIRAVLIHSRADSRTSCRQTRRPEKKHSQSNVATCVSRCRRFSCSSPLVSTFSHYCDQDLLVFHGLITPLFA